jgi:glycosyltransferase involved in cell wall biosynthesis
MNQTICLVAICKNERHCIKETLDSVVKHIDCYCISDTGSTDGTQEFVRSYFKERNIPGEVIENIPWKNFGYNRTEVMKRAKGKANYLFVMDADDLFIGDTPFPELKCDSYRVEIISGNNHYYRRQLFANDLDWHYVGVLHEFPECAQEKTVGILEGYSIISRRLGSRNKDPKKMEKDIQTFLDGIKDEPHNSRYHFYTGQSYRDAGQLDKAIEYYKKRSQMGGYPEEIYYSLYQIAECLVRLSSPFEDILTACIKAYDYRPTHIESLYTLTRYCRETKRYELGYFIGKLAANTSYPKDDTLFIDKSIYDYKLFEEIGVCASWIGKPKIEWYNKALTCKDIPESDRMRIQECIDRAKGNRLEGDSLVTNAEKPIIREYAKGKKCLVEVGVAFGGTSQIIREVMDPTAKYYLVDPFLSTKVPGQNLTADFERAKNNVNSVKNGEVIWLRQTSVDAAKQFQDRPDFIFIDGLHDFNSVLVDWSVWHNYVLPGGYILFHDVSTGWPGVKAAFEIIRNTTGWEYLGVKESIGIMRRLPT